MSGYYYFTDLFDAPPSGVSGSLTIAGFLSHGRKRFPGEWDALMGDRQAPYRLLDHVANYRGPSEEMYSRLTGAALQAILER